MSATRGRSMIWLRTASAEEAVAYRDRARSAHEDGAQLEPCAPTAAARRRLTNCGRKAKKISTASVEYVDQDLRDDDLARYLRRTSGSTPERALLGSVIPHVEKIGERRECEGPGS